MKRSEIYFMILGIGIGVFVSGLVLNQYPTPRVEYTDEEIRERARDLGMVGIRESIENNEESSEEKVNETEKVDETEPPEEEENTENISTTVTIKILEGDTTDDIVDKLVTSGIISDGDDFRQFAIQETNGGRAFRQGTYSIDPESEYEEIINILTKGAF